MPTPHTWSAQQYTAFEEDRTRPVRDLLANVLTPNPRSAIDLGCGPGNSTEVLAACYPHAAIQGLDSSPDMLEAARRRLPGLTFEHTDLNAWRPTGTFDVILSNAVLHWLPDHPALFPRLASHLAPGGTLAVQMPDNLDEPTHALMRSVAETGPWAPALASAAATRTPMATPAAFYAMLRPHCPRIDIWRTTYNHVMPNLDAIVEWFKGSGLRPFLAPLSPQLQAEYLARYRTLLAEAYPTMPDGTVLLPLPRLFILATK